MNNGFDVLNQFGKERQPCFFLINYELNDIQVYHIQDLEKENIAFQFPDYSSVSSIPEIIRDKIILEKFPIELNEYLEIFQKMMSHIHRGDSYLINLTFSTPIQVNQSLENLFHRINATYKIRYKNDWLCFSPESFVKIRDNKIATFPMKGTIDADVPNASFLLKNNQKEIAEHSTIVDFLRNDLSKIAQDVHVKRLMYLDEIKTNQGNILQMSSEIVGDLATNWQENLGSVLNELLPAGSICGAPKNKTLDIIQENETHQRGFYTGIAGYFDGKSLDTCVLIRFIENTPNGMVYKSGGGITYQSDAILEYNELNQKIYVPVS